MKITEAQKKYAADLAERVVMTFIQAVIGVYAVALIAGQSSVLSDTSFAMKAAIAGAAAVASLLKGLIAKALTSSETASALPARLDTTDSPAPSPSDAAPTVLQAGTVIINGTLSSTSNPSDINGGNSNVYVPPPDTAPDTTSTPDPGTTSPMPPYAEEGDV